MKLYLPTHILGSRVLAPVLGTQQVLIKCLLLRTEVNYTLGSLRFLENSSGPACGSTSPALRVPRSPAGASEQRYPVGLARAQPSTRGPPCPGAVLPDRTLRLLQTAVGAEAWVSSPSASSCLLSCCCCSSFRTPLQLSTPRAPAETLGL